jgi:hypothetical protein
MSMGTTAATRAEQERTHRWVEIAWRVGVVQAVATALILLVAGRNILLSAHYPLVSALAVLVLALGVRRGSRVAAVILFVGVLAPSAIKLAAGVLQPVDIAAFPLAAVYGLGVAGSFRRQ